MLKHFTRIELLVLLEKIDLEVKIEDTVEDAADPIAKAAVQHQLLPTAKKTKIKNPKNDVTWPMQTNLLGQNMSIELRQSLKM